MLQIGDFQIHLINDAKTKVDVGGAFGLVPRKLYARYMEPDADNLIPMVHHCLFLKAGDKNIVVDTGMGEKLDDKQKQFWYIEDAGGLRRGLNTLGYQPEDIDLVILTHLHGDHAGGATLFAEDDPSKVQATFPNAEYVVQKREYEDATHPNERTRGTYFDVNFQPLMESGQLRLLDGDTELAPGITGVVTPGHTPGHMSVKFESNGEHALFVCDMASYAVHFERIAWMTAWDVEPLVTLESKRIWQKWALESDATLIFVHDSQRKVGKLTQDERGRLTLQAIEENYV